MEVSNTFDLNASLSLWLERLAQSPHFRKENVVEMESHVRDSVAQLHSQGLSEEESFLIAIRRVGSVKKLEPEYAKMNRNWRNLIAHGLILVFFSAGSFFLWGTLQVTIMLMRGNLARAGAVDSETGLGMLPGFTELMFSYSSFLVIPPLLALIYCLFVWFRKSRVNCSWTGFFAATAATLIFMTFPTVLAVLLPVLDFMNRLPMR